MYDGVVSVLKSAFVVIQEYLEILEKVLLVLEVVPGAFMGVFKGP